jgi:hypothetical protein
MDQGIALSLSNTKDNGQNIGDLGVIEAAEQDVYANFEFAASSLFRQNTEQFDDSDEEYEQDEEEDLDLESMNPQDLNKISSYAENDIDMDQIVEGASRMCVVDEGDRGGQEDNFAIQNDPQNQNDPFTLGAPLVSLDSRDTLIEEGADNPKGEEERESGSAAQRAKTLNESMVIIEQADLKKLLHTIAHLKMQVDEEKGIVEGIKADCSALDGFEMQFQRENQVWEAQMAREMQGSASFVEAEFHHSDNVTVLDAFLEERVDLLKEIGVCEASVEMYQRLIRSAEIRVTQLREVDDAA